ncbi:hypothetical protein GCM10011507_17360 [Edaphobacter acidisoli]|uniref:Outer membrane protein beta-barrel domain-containing protein n=1 Tax=Edaphobacter acidisoli TaxID=2040573 RepID=A0A916W4U6_9BACT|nr:outer membrane beta-barrel protein [Edaphobacter acidisoli]GGA66360.1 hypothetical protein GCM10011507_17360 [Edaphobacter acidisoli]
MLNPPRLSCVFAALLCVAAVLAGPTAQAQYDSPTIPGPISDALSHVDIGVSGVGSITQSSTGPVQNSTQPAANVSIDPSKTVGALITVRYTFKPLVGFEFNYGYSRYDQKFTGVSGTPGVFGVQNNAKEYTFGYVAQLHQYFGLTPFVAGGGGTTAFRPTTNGGQGLLSQGRATYYYAVGANTNLGSKHFGLRAQFRQKFYIAPDFGQNYLTILKHTSTFEPGIGFFIHF